MMPELLETLALWREVTASGPATVAEVLEYHCDQSGVGPRHPSVRAHELNTRALHGGDLLRVSQASGGTRRFELTDCRLDTATEATERTPSRSGEEALSCA